MRGVGSFGRLTDFLFDIVFPCETFVHHAVYSAPVRQASDVSVINEEVNPELPCIMHVLVDVFFREVFVHGIELDAPLSAPLYGVVKEFSLPYSPQDELVSFSEEGF